MTEAMILGVLVVISIVLIIYGLMPGKKRKRLPAPEKFNISDK